MVNCADDSTSKSAGSLCIKLLMNTVKRDVSSVDACYELSSIPLFRSSHSFQNVSLTGCRVLQQSAMNTITKCTIVDKYLSRHDDDNSSLYQYICRNGKVPVISAPTQATWPLNEQYCRTSLLLHWPNWRTTLDIKSDDTSWTEKFIEFLDFDTCPNFV